MKAISIKQPYASLIVKGIKNIENRTWKCPEKYIGKRILIHASARGYSKVGLTDQQKEAAVALWTKTPLKSRYFGAIIGSAVIVDCVENHHSIWAEKGVWNWVLANAVEFEHPIPAKGKLSFWDAKYWDQQNIEDFRQWLQEDGISYFRHIFGLTGSVTPILNLNMKKRGLPIHPIHFREGMQIRNWMRKHINCVSELDACVLDDTYSDFILDACNKNGSLTKKNY